MGEAATKGAQATAYDFIVFVLNEKRRNPAVKEWKFKETDLNTKPEQMSTHLLYGLWRYWDTAPFKQTLEELSVKNGFKEYSVCSGVWNKVVGRQIYDGYLYCNVD